MNGWMNQWLIQKGGCMGSTEHPLNIKYNEACTDVMDACMIWQMNEKAHGILNVYGATMVICV